MTQTTHSGLTVPLMTFPASSPHACQVSWYVTAKCGILVSIFMLFSSQTLCNY